VNRSDKAIRILTTLAVLVVAGMVLAVLAAMVRMVAFLLRKPDIATVTVPAIPSPATPAAIYAASTVGFTPEHASVWAARMLDAAPQSIDY
jgi:hypothetical protein